MSAKMTPHTSIRKRLSLYLGGGLLGLWLGAALIGIWASLHEINEAADTQMTQLARTLLQLAPRVEDAADVEDIESLLPHAHGDAESDHHGFALWDGQGRLLLADRHGKAMPWRAESGFVNSGTLWRAHSWRYFYVQDAARTRTVAVAQDRRERLDILMEAAAMQLALMLLSVPLLLWLLAYGIRRGLAPLHQLAHDLQARDVYAQTPLSEAVPRETQPLVAAMNALLERMTQAMARERRFTADAAHELRSPLAGLQVQCEVLALGGDAAMQQHHLAHIQTSLARARHLIDQLLALSRLDALSGLDDAQSVDWPTVIHDALHSVNLAAREKHIRLKLTYGCAPDAVLPLQGHAVLLQLLLRNVLDNAIRYSPPARDVHIHGDADGLTICDQGPGVAADILPRLGERFFRPAGQSAQGSGLGLSIAARIAELHGLRFAHQPGANRRIVRACGTGGT